MFCRIYQFRRSLDLPLTALNYLLMNIEYYLFRTSNLASLAFGGVSLYTADSLILILQRCLVGMRPL